MIQNYSKNKRQIGNDLFKNNFHITFTNVKHFLKPNFKKVNNFFYLFSNYLHYLIVSTINKTLYIRAIESVMLFTSLECFYPHAIFHNKVKKVTSMEIALPKYQIFI